MRIREEMNTTTNRSVYSKAYRFVIARESGKCSYCGWHSGENASSRQEKHGKPKHKDHK